MDLLHVLIAALAGWRIASLISTEHGPWGVFLWLRRRYSSIEMEWVEASQHNRYFYMPFGIGKLITCVWCTSVWTVGAMFVAYEYAPWPVAMIAAMGAAIVVERFARGAE